MLETGKYKSTIRFLYQLFGGIALGFVMFIIAVNFNFLWLFGGMPSLQELENPKSQVASLIISEDGQEIGKYFRENRNHHVRIFLLNNSQLFRHRQILFQHQNIYVYLQHKNLVFECNERLHIRHPYFFVR